MLILRTQVLPYHLALAWLTPDPPNGCSAQALNKLLATAPVISAEVTLKLLLRRSSLTIINTLYALAQEAAAVAALVFAVDIVTVAFTFVPVVVTSFAAPDCLDPACVCSS